MGSKPIFADRIGRKSAMRDRNLAGQEAATGGRMTDPRHLTRERVFHAAHEPGNALTSYAIGIKISATA